MSPILESHKASQDTDDATSKPASIFLSAEQRQAFLDFSRGNSLAKEHLWALFARVDARAASPGLSGPETTTEWWHHVAEYVSDAAIAHALQPRRNPCVADWLRAQTLTLARRPLTDWVGPFFRDHNASPPCGHLETAHVVWAVASALDLAPAIFTKAELDECRARLREGVAMCHRWLDTHATLNNWRAVLSSGLAVGGAVLDDAALLDRAETEYRLCLKMFQADGSYGESLQYANYATFTLVLTYESLVRRRPELASSLPLISDAQLPRWQAYSHFYCKPLAGWGAVAKPRAANFNDSAAIFRPTADVLLHFATRAREASPVNAGLARWLLEETYRHAFDGGPHDRATFGFYNGLHFLAYSLLPNAAPAQTPAEAELPATQAFSNGNAFARDAWDGRTILAINGGGDAYRTTSHLHLDLNSFILAHNQERLLVDPGHSCYRNAIRAIDCSTASHNTCTFECETPAPDGDAQHAWPHLRNIEQKHRGSIQLNQQTHEPTPPVDRGARRLFVGRRGVVSAIASEASLAYGAPIKDFTRVWLQCGSNVLFIIDRIEASLPVKTTWNWLLNNRDGELQFRTFPDRLVARRPRAGMKLFSCANARLTGPTYSYVHDCYHPRPNQLGEGATGTGMLLRFVEQQAATQRIAAHAIAMDASGDVASWHFKNEDGRLTVSHQFTGEGWSLDLSAGFDRLTLSNLVNDERCAVETTGKTWRWAD